MSQLEASEFSIPAFICPYCGGQNQRDGQDSLESKEVCYDCEEEVTING